MTYLFGRTIPTGFYHLHHSVFFGGKVLYLYNPLHLFWGWESLLTSTWAGSRMNSAGRCWFHPPRLALIRRWSGAFGQPRELENKQTKNTTSNFMLFLWWGWGCFFVALKFWWPKHVSFFGGVVIVINGCLCWKRSGSPEGCCNPHPCTYIADGNITHLFCRAFWAQDLQREGWPGVGDKESNENTRLLLS